VEAHRNVRINELNQQYNELSSQLEFEKEREKALQKLTKVKGNKGWWEVPSEELNHHELQKNEPIIGGAP
jgi:pheromone receptor transcription factor